MMQSLISLEQRKYNILSRSWIEKNQFSPFQQQNQQQSQLITGKKHAY